MQETSHWLTHRWNVISEQRKSNWQHPNSYYREREEPEHSATDECDTNRHPHPFRTLPTKAVQITDDPGRNVILEALHFLVEIGNLRHQFVPMAARRKRSPWDQHAQATMWRALIGRDPQIVEPANGNARRKRCPLLAQNGRPNRVGGCPLYKRCKDWAGPTVATCTSTPAGLAMPPTRANTRKN